jgi:predicted house-cleaning noncanonical NTP pyrophosphatase (MazG superfamily)
MTVYNKLVRDKIIEHIQSKGEDASYYVACPLEYKEKLLHKLEEEVKEFQEARNQEELADILEVIDALVKYFDWDMDEVQALQKEKREKKGSFSKRLILEES